ncbi:MAG: DUF134 domain-containing protein [Desulfofustis sp.]|jgi:predicted DNA-binding protein (UPF0251 family)|nr:DUF134 domain-containing protein [Desulfofustis sp.]
MVRPRKPRFVSAYPTLTAFVPQGINITGETILTVEQFEAIRLSDFEHLDQEGGAAMMGVSRHTFGRLLAGGRSAVAEAMVTGKVLKVEGGDYEIRGPGRGRGLGQGRRRRGGGGFGRP